MEGKDGVFVDCRSCWKGRIGRAAASFARFEGGIARLGGDGPDRGPGLARTALQLGVRLRLLCRSEEGAADWGREVLIRQENDPAPKFHFLEEGPVRLGLRVAFDLLDEEGHYHGDGHQDVWVYPEGDFHLSWALQVVDASGHGQVRDAYVEVAGNRQYERIGLGAAELGAGSAERFRPFGGDWPEKAIVLKGKQAVAGLYWARDAGQVWEVGSDHGRLPPFYASRWPTGMQQWSRGRMGWACDASAGVSAAVGEEGPALCLAWLKDAAAEGEVTHAASLVVSLCEDEEELRCRIAAVQQPLRPEVKGGDFRCYTEEDGTYEIGQGDPTRVEIVFPPDPLARRAHLRFYRRKTDPRHRGGVRARVEGRPVRCQLMSEGELTDDICVVMEMAHRSDSVDDVLLSAKLSAESPTSIVIEKVPGIQAVYQSEISGLDLQRRAGNRRDVVVWSSRNKERPLYEFDLFSGALHRPTQYGRREPALWEMPMSWFKSCGISKHHYCNCVKAFSMRENGPEAVELYFRGTNPNQRAQSELWLRTPFAHPRLRLEVRMRLEILQQWDDADVEFSDIFPYPSRLVETWFHDAVLFLQRDQSAMIYTCRPDRSVPAGGQSEDGRLFYGLFATGRGNVLTLIENPQHPRHRLHYSVCGNYIDIHLNLRPGRVPVPAGEVFEIEYVVEFYGDERTTADEIRRIGMRSLEAGDIVID